MKRDKGISGRELVRRRESPVPLLRKSPEVFGCTPKKSQKWEETSQTAVVSGGRRTFTTDQEVVGEVGTKERDEPRKKGK